MTSREKFSPCREQAVLFPDVSGNAINGLGEAARRRPSYVYWANDPDEIAHGALQKWFYTVDPGLPEYEAVRKERARILAEPLKPITERRTDIKDDDVTSFYRSCIESKIFDKAGVTAFDPQWAYEGVTIPFRNIVILGVQHDYEEIRKAPAPEGGLEVMRQYKRAAFAAKYFANWLREHGWDAEPLTGPMSGKLTMIPPAIAAGFGELGKHGSIINPEFGASFRLSAVLTDCPLPMSTEQKHGVDDFCVRCQICENACPPDAIFKTKQTVRGVEKWYVDFDKCLPFFNEHQGCAICIAACPWSRPGVGLNLARKLKARSERLSRAG